MVLAEHRRLIREAVASHAASRSIRRATPSCARSGARLTRSPRPRTHSARWRKRRCGCGWGSTRRADPHRGGLRRRRPAPRSAGDGGRPRRPGTALAGDARPARRWLVRDLGEHRLKDLTHPQRLYQLLADGLRADFPPLADAREPPHEPPDPADRARGQEAKNWTSCSCSCAAMMCACSR